MYNVGDIFKGTFGQAETGVIITIIDKDESGFRAPECKYLVLLEELTDRERVTAMAGDEFITALIQETYFEEVGQN